jgi:polyisoprenyl-teichoic acid--peptidoglycan teichoic acid transferase
MPRRPLALFASLSALALGIIALSGPTASPADAQSATGLTLKKAHQGESLPALDGKKPIFVLVLGSDSRSKQPEAIAHGRSDVIELVGLNPQTHRASILGFPRDSWVNVPGHGMNKINDAMYFGGPEGAVSMIEGLTGIHIDYYAINSFFGFRQMVSELGGVDVVVPYEMNDSYSKAHFKPGKHHFSGKEALAFTRDRHDPPTGDFGRSFNCGTMLISFLKDFQEDFAQNPAHMLNWIGAGSRHVRTDLSFDELASFAFLASEMPLKKVNNFVVPGSTGMEGTESVVHISSSANALYSDLRDDGYISKG